eukprot:5732995-Pleurochrysis_carterae.AAC.2
MYYAYSDALVEVALELEELGPALVGELLGNSILRVVCFDDVDESVDAARLCCCAQSSRSQMPSCTAGASQNHILDEPVVRRASSNMRDHVGQFKRSEVRSTQRRHLGLVAALPLYYTRPSIRQGFGAYSLSVNFGEPLAAEGRHCVAYSS